MVTVVQPISPPFNRICKGVTIFKAGCTYMVINHLAKQYFKAGIFFYLNNWWTNYRPAANTCLSELVSNRSSVSKHEGNSRT